MGNDVKKYALIINGDTEARHFDNVEKSLNVLNKDGYETFVASPQEPSEPADHYTQSNLGSVENLINKLKEEIDDNDELVIYTTGHGDKKNDLVSLCLEDGCDAEGMSYLLDDIEYGERTIIMDQCFSGNWNKIFLDDPKSLFIAAGSEDESVCCHNFAPYFWSEDVTDYNGDGIISWQERYAYTVDKGLLVSIPQFIPSPGYTMPGKTSFNDKVEKIHDGDVIEEKLSNLQPGQYAVMMFSADWCAACDNYEPHFLEQAKKAGGQHLWMISKDEALAEKYNVFSFPTIVLFNGEGYQYAVSDRENIEAEITNFYLSKKELIQMKIEAAKAIENEVWSGISLHTLAHVFIVDGMEDAAIDTLLAAVEKAKNSSDDFSRYLIIKPIYSDLPYMPYMNLGPKGAVVLEKLVDVVLAMGDEQKVQIFWEMAAAFGNSQMGEKAIPYLEKLIGGSQEIEDRTLRVVVLCDIAGAYIKMGMVDDAQKILERTIIIVNCIKNEYNKASALGSMAAKFYDLGYEDYSAVLLNQTITLADSLKDDLLSAELYGNIGFGFVEINNDIALEVFEKGVEAARGINGESIKVARGKSLLLAKLAYSLAVIGEKEKAISVFEDSIKALKESKDLFLPNLNISEVRKYAKKVGLEDELQEIIDKEFPSTWGNP